MSMGLPILVHTMQQDIPWILLVTHNQIGQEIALIASPLQDMSSTLDQDLSVGQVISDHQFLYHRHRQSTWVQ
jgi:hypothetical protein